MCFYQKLLYLVALLVLVPSVIHAGECNPGFPEHNPDTIYLVHGDGTVTDTRTHLMWKQCSEGQNWDGSACVGSASFYVWEEALALTEGYAFARYRDWRLPNRNELQSLIETCRITKSPHYPTINATVFSNTPTWIFWSSSPIAEYSDFAWTVHFGFGYVLGHPRSTDYYVRLVRSGQ